MTYSPMPSVARTSEIEQRHVLSPSDWAADHDRMHVVPLESKWSGWHPPCDDIVGPERIGSTYKLESTNPLLQ
jgi:hypothetical protein